MKKEELAKLLTDNDIDMIYEIISEHIQEIEDGDLVIVYGQSDDLMEFRGVIRDEVGAYDGGTAYFTKEGLLESECDEGEDCPYFQKEQKKASKVEAIWDTTVDGQDVSWHIKTDLPHEPIKIYEDGDLYCVGLVFCLDDVE